MVILHSIFCTLQTLQPWKKLKITNSCRTIDILKQAGWQSLNGKPLLIVVFFWARARVIIVMRFPQRPPVEPLIVTKTTREVICSHSTCMAALAKWNMFTCRSSALLDRISSTEVHMQQLLQLQSLMSGYSQKLSNKYRLKDTDFTSAGSNMKLHCKNYHVYITQNFV